MKKIWYTLAFVAAVATLIGCGVLLTASAGVIPGEYTH